MERATRSRPRTVRGRAGWVRAGRLAPLELGLPLSRARELVLEAAWARVAGDSLARRARPTGIHRGVLEIELDDERWRSIVADLVPRLAGRLAGAYPELGVRRLRIVLGESPGAGPATAVEAIAQGVEQAPPAERAPEHERPRREPTPDPEERLRALSLDYLRRSRDAQKP